jgi:hypothetical protein
LITHILYICAQAPAIVKHETGCEPQPRIQKLLKGDLVLVTDGTVAGKVVGLGIVEDPDP